VIFFENEVAKSINKSSDKKEKQRPFCFLSFPPKTFQKEQDKKKIKKRKKMHKRNKLVRSLFKPSDNES